MNLVKLTASVWSAALILTAPPSLAAQSTVSASKKIEIQFIRQKTPTECGRAVLASLISRRGGDIEAIYNGIRPPSDPDAGYSISEMIAHAARAGIRLSARAPLGVTKTDSCEISPNVLNYLRSLVTTLESGRPIVVPVRIDGVGSHYIVLTQFADNQFMILDPLADGPRKIAAGELAMQMCKFGYLAFEAR